MMSLPGWSGQRMGPEGVVVKRSVRGPTWRRHFTVHEILYVDSTPDCRIIGALFALRRAPSGVFGIFDPVPGRGGSDHSPTPAEQHPRPSRDDAGLRSRTPYGLLAATRACSALLTRTSGGRHVGRTTEVRLMRHRRAFMASLLVLLLTVIVSPTVGSAAPEGQLTWGVHISLAPTWLDPAEAPGIITPYVISYALHDALVKPMPGQPDAPSLAESWSVSQDGLVYELVLLQGVKFHNGEPVTADDVKFSFERYRGSANKTLKERVAAIETPDPGHVPFRLKQPWPDFLTFYTGASGAGWIVPKKYVEKVGDDGFKKAPVGAGPYKFVSFTPGVARVLEAYYQYWRETPIAQRLRFQPLPDEPA